MSTSSTRGSEAAQQPARARKDVQRERAVTVALELAGREGVAGLTMRRLGEELRVDPAVIYRLFRDKDELLLAAFDRVTAGSLDALGPVDDGEPWPDTLRRVADATLETMSRYPAVAALTFARTTGGPAERRMVELILSTFARSGLPPEQTVLYYRAFVDAILGLCGQDAAIATLDPQVREKDAAAWSRIYAKLPEQQYPTAHAHIAELVAVDESAIYRTVVESIIAAAERAAAAG